MAYNIAHALARKSLPLLPCRDPWVIPSLQVPALVEWPLTMRCRALMNCIESTSNVLGGQSAEEVPRQAHLWALGPGPSEKHPGRPAAPRLLDPGPSAVVFQTFAKIRKVAQRCWVPLGLLQAGAQQGWARAAPARPFLSWYYSVYRRAPLVATNIGSKG